MPHHAQKRHTRKPRAFTLIELVSVLVLVSILSATAIPALARLDRARDAALLNECDRLIRFSQAHANSTGMPTGARFDLDDQSVAVLTIGTTPGSASSVLRAGTGLPIELSVSSAFPGASLASSGGQTSGTAVLWFDYDGSPQTRDSSGEHPLALTEEFIVRVSSGSEIRVQPSTGVILR
jgi:prepilin-type N-terminal cleavage/methylation domain-containing protein